MAQKIYVEQPGRRAKPSPNAIEYFDENGNKLEFKRGDRFEFEIYFEDETTLKPKSLASGSMVQVGVKADDDFDSDYIGFGYTEIDPASDSDPYLVTVSLNVADIHALFTTTDTQYLNCMFEISWTEDGQLNWESTAGKIRCRVYNDVVRHDSTAPVPDVPSSGKVTVAAGVEAAEDLAEGDLVDIYDDSGTTKMRKANAATALQADGYVDTAVLTGATDSVYNNGSVSGFVGLTRGGNVYLGASGGILQTPPATGMVQAVGVASSDTTISVNVQDPAAYNHAESPAATQWNITHNLGRNPAVYVLETGGGPVVPQITHNSINDLTLDFISGIEGSANLS